MDQHPTVEALARELSYYVAQGDKDRSKQVQEQLADRGYTVDDDGHPVKLEDKPKAPAKKAAAPKETRPESAPREKRA